MPQIIVEHVFILQHVVANDLKEKLRLLCAKILSTVDDYSAEPNDLGPEDFSFKFDLIKSPSEQTHDVIVRIHLDQTEERIERSDLCADMIRTLVLLTLGVYRRPNATVGVSLTYGYVEWSGGSAVDRDMVTRVLELIAQ